MSNQILPLALRPKSLSALIGQSNMVNAIRNQAAKRLPQAWMFIGDPGTGKSTTARIIARALQCTHEGYKWGDPCEACYKAEWNIHEINAARSSDENSVDRAANIAEMSRYQPSSGKYRVMIIDEFQLLTPKAQDVLLKDFEEPPPTTIWIICTTAPNKIVPAMKRRCKTATYQLKSIGHEGRSILLKRALNHISYPAGSIDTVKFMEAADRAALSPSDFLASLEQVAAGMPIQEAIEGISTDVDSLALCRAVIQGNWDGVKKALQKVQAGEARLVRASVSGYLKGCMVKDFKPSQRMSFAESLIDLSGGPLDDGQILIWLWGVLYKVARRFKQ